MHGFLYHGFEMSWLTHGLFTSYGFVPEHDTKAKNSAKIKVILLIIKF